MSGEDAMAAGGAPGGPLSVREYSDIPLLPLLPDSTQNQLNYVLPAEFGQPFDHLRFRNEAVESSSRYTEPVAASDPFRLPGTFLYGGVIFPDFGNFIAESLHRLWPVLTDKACRDLPIIFHSTGPGLSGEMALPVWMEQIFALLGIDSSRLLLVDRPLRPERLIVPTQGSMLGMGSVSADYDRIFPPRREGQAEARPRTGHLYVSRSKYLFSGSYLGEMLVEEVLRDSGQFEILHPQEHPVAEVVDKLESCASAVFAEGSALHILELCRAPPPKTFVILRRDRQSWRKFYELMVAKRCAEVELLDLRDRLGSFTWSPNTGAASSAKAAALHDIPALLRAVAQFCGVGLREPSEREVKTGQAMSLLNLILDQRTIRNNTPLDIVGSMVRVLQWQATEFDFLPFDLPKSGPTPKAPAKTSREPRAPSGGDDGSPRRLRPVR